MKKVVIALFGVIIVLILFLILSYKAPEPILTNQEICGEWKNIYNDELVYKFTSDGSHERYNKGNLFYSGTYSIRGEKISFTESTGERSSGRIKILDESSIDIWIAIPFDLSGYISTSLVHTKTC